MRGVGGVGAHYVMISRRGHRSDSKRPERHMVISAYHICERIVLLRDTIRTSILALKFVKVLEFRPSFLDKASSGSMIEMLRFLVNFLCQGLPGACAPERLTFMFPNSRSFPHRHRRRSALRFHLSNLSMRILKLLINPTNRLSRSVKCSSVCARRLVTSFCKV